jgi:hypothetical protein
LKKNSLCCVYVRDGAGKLQKALADCASERHARRLCVAHALAEPRERRVCIAQGLCPRGLNLRHARARIAHAGARAIEVRDAEASVKVRLSGVLLKQSRFFVRKMGGPRREWSRRHFELSDSDAAPLRYNPGRIDLNTLSADLQVQSQPWTHFENAGEVYANLVMSLPGFDVEVNSRAFESAFIFYNTWFGPTAHASPPPQPPIQPAYHARRSRR